MFLSLVECTCRYVSPAKGEDLVTVDVWVVGISRLRVRLRYEIRRDDTLLATASTQNAFVDADGRPRRLPVDHPAWQRLREL